MDHPAPELPTDGLRFIGYLNRRPYLWSVDVVTRSIEPAAKDLRSLPQGGGINEVVVLGESVGFRCGPFWYRLEPDLSGKPIPIVGADYQMFQEASTGVSSEPQADRSHGFRDRVTLRVDGGQIDLEDHRVGSWGMSGTLSPDRTLVAIGAETAATTAFIRERLALGLSIVEEMKVEYPPSRWLMFIVEVDSGSLTACEGEFKNTCYRAAWTVSGEWFAFETPFDPKKLYVAHRTGGRLNEIAFRRHAPAPMIDCALLPDLAE